MMSQMKMDFSNEVFLKRLGGVDFDATEVTIPRPSGTIRETYYSTVMKGYAILVIVIYKTEQDKQELGNILDKITFSQPATHG